MNRGIVNIKTGFWITVPAFFVGMLWPAVLSAQDNLNTDNQSTEQILFMNLNDIPLMPGLEELPDHTLIFDKPGGRIIESAMVAQNINRDAIELFYNQTLPQLGWVRINQNAFIRRNEKLHLSIEEEEKYSVLFLRIEPR